MSDTRVTVYMYNSLKNHVLSKSAHVTAADGSNVVQVFRMAEPGTRMMSVDLIFAANRIFISGDLRVTGDRGVVSDLGYGLAWFAGLNGEDYLAEKFLRKRYVPELAVEGLKDLAERYFADRFLEDEEPTDEAKWKKLRIDEEVERGTSGACCSQTELYEFFQELNLDTSDGVPGFGYDPAEVGWLAAIQQRFAELYAAEFGK